ncbi:MAG TPA: hypothetical protein VLI04_13885 [Nocardioidaceae bacterium]|nr:hypothetical protein [Nocardioidaceae bacterium]
MFKHFPPTDATADAPDEIHYPELVAQLERLGFERVGRVRLDVPVEEWQQLLSQYTHHDAEVMVAHEAIPSVVLVAPEGDAYVEVDWFYDSPSIRFRTLLQDQTIVETQRAWNHDPAWPRRLHRALPYRDRREEQLLDVAKGRDLVIAKSETVEQVWQEHRERVARASVEPVPHRNDMSQVLSLWDRLLAHGMRCAVRARRVALVVHGLVPLLATVLCLWLTVSGRVLWGLAVLWMFGILPVLVSSRTAIRIRYVRWLRPPLR